MKKTVIFFIAGIIMGWAVASVAEELHKPELGVQLDQYKYIYDLEEVAKPEGEIEDIGTLVLRPLETITESTQEILTPKAEIVYEGQEDLDKLPGGPKLRFSF